MAGRCARQVRTTESDRLMKRIHALHTAHDGVIGLQGVPQRRRWWRKAFGLPPDKTQNHSKLNITTTSPNTKYATDITYIRTVQGWLYLSVVLELYSGLVAD